MDAFPLTVTSGYLEEVGADAPDGRLGAFNRDAYSWLLRYGQVTTFYGQRDSLSHTHLLACGVDLQASEAVACAELSLFGDSDHTEERAMVVGRACCQCGEVRQVSLTHAPLSVAELIRAVSDHAQQPAAFGAQPVLEVGGLYVSEAANQLNPHSRAERTGFWSAVDTPAGVRVRYEVRRAGAKPRPELLDPALVEHVLGRLRLVAGAGSWE